MTLYYCRQSNGNDTNNGTSPATAFATIGHVLATLASGDVAYIGAGTYRESGLTCANSGSVTSKAVTGATNASPIVITCTGHGAATGQVVTLTGVQGNTAANGGWRITVLDANTFSLDGSVGNGTYTAATGVMYLSIGMFADVDGSATGDAGQVRITTVTAESGGAAPSSTQLVKCNGKSLWLWQGFALESNGVDGVFDSRNILGARGWTLRSCVLTSWLLSSTCIYIIGQGNPLNWFVDSCILSSNSNAGVGPVFINLPLTSGGSSDYDSYIWFTNCMFLLHQSSGVQITASGGGSFHGGGVRFLNSNFVGGSNAVSTIDGNLSSGIPVRVYNCHFESNGTCLAANTAGQIVEDYNLLQGVVIRTNVSIGSHSKTGVGYISAASFGYEWLVGRQGRAFLTPNSESALLAFCQPVGTVIGGDVVTPAVDMLGRPRPAGGTSLNVAAGCLERHDTGILQSAVTHSVGSAMQLSGPADHDLYVNIDAATTRISISVQYDTAGQPPILLIKANAAAGIPADVPLTWSDPGVNTWSTMTVTLTATTKSVLTLRLATARGTGSAFFDDARFN